MPIVAVSGGFDPLHQGHIALIEAAAEYGDVVVILNSDEWLMRKKGYVFQPWEARALIMSALRDVLTVHSVDDSDGTVLSALRKIGPDYFANGGDRGPENTPEMVYCLDYGIRPLWGIGGGKLASSSELVGRARVG